MIVRQQRLSQSPVQSRPRRATAAQVMFLFDRAQTQQLLKLAADLPDNNNGRNRGRMYSLIFALMYGLGLRVGEAARLCRQDVDLERNLLVIRETKFLKSRLVPFGPKLGMRLREYLQQQTEDAGVLPPNTPLFSFGPDRSQAINPGTISLGPLLYSFFEDYLKCQKGLRPSSLKSYRDSLKLLCRCALCRGGGTQR